MSDTTGHDHDATGTASAPGTPENAATPTATAPEATDAESLRPDARPRVADRPLDDEEREALDQMTRDIGDVPAVEIISTAAVHLMSAAAVKIGLAQDPEHERDLDEARKLLEALAGLVVAGAPAVGNLHARSLRDGLRTLQLAFREASIFPDAPGKGPGEKYTGPVN